MPALERDAARAVEPCLPRRRAEGCAAGRDSSRRCSPISRAEAEPRRGDGGARLRRPGATRLPRPDGVVREPLDSGRSCAGRSSWGRCGSSTRGEAVVFVSGLVGIGSSGRSTYLVPGQVTLVLGPSGPASRRCFAPSRDSSRLPRRRVSSRTGRGRPALLRRHGRARRPSPSDLFQDPRQVGLYACLNESLSGWRTSVPRAGDRDTCLYALRVVAQSILSGRLVTRFVLAVRLQQRVSRLDGSRSAEFFCSSISRLRSSTRAAESLGSSWPYARPRRGTAVRSPSSGRPCRSSLRPGYSSSPGTPGVSWPVARPRQDRRATTPVRFGRR